MPMCDRSDHPGLTDPRREPPPPGGRPAWQRALGLWLVIQLMICAVGPVLRLDLRPGPSHP